MHTFAHLKFIVLNRKKETIKTTLNKKKLGLSWFYDTYDPVTYIIVCFFLKANTVVYEGVDKRT